MDEALQCTQEPKNAREMVLVFHQNGRSTVSASLIAPGSRLVGFGLKAMECEIALGEIDHFHDAKDKG